jgi:hypothetical protein
MARTEKKQSILGGFAKPVATSDSYLCLVCHSFSLSAWYIATTVGTVFVKILCLQLLLNSVQDKHLIPFEQ